MILRYPLPVYKYYRQHIFRPQQEVWKSVFSAPAAPITRTQSEVNTATTPEHSANHARRLTSVPTAPAVLDSQTPSGVPAVSSPPPNNEASTSTVFDNTTEATSSVRLQTLSPARTSAATPAMDSVTTHAHDSDATAIKRPLEEDSADDRNDDRGGVRKKVCAGSNSQP